MYMGASKNNLVNFSVSVSIQDDKDEENSVIGAGAKKWGMWVTKHESAMYSSIIDCLKRKWNSS